MTSTLVISLAIIAIVVIVIIIMACYSSGNCCQKERSRSRASSVSSVRHSPIAPHSPQEEGVPRAASPASAHSSPASEKSHSESASPASEKSHSERSSPALRSADHEVWTPVHSPPSGTPRQIIRADEDHDDFRSVATPIH